MHWVAEMLGLHPMDAYQLVSQIAQVPVANVVDANYSVVVKAAKQRLGELEAALAHRAWLVGEDFTVADLLMASVLELAVRFDLLGDHPALAAWQRAVYGRPAHRKAQEDQLAEMRAHTRADMHLEDIP